MSIAKPDSKRPLVAGVLATLALPAQADWTLVNMPRGVSELSRGIFDLHMLMLWICVVIAFFTFGAMIVAMVRFRKSRGAVADQKFLHNARLEAAWTIIPVLILIGMAIPSVEKLVMIEDTSGSGLTVKVTGHQWYWQYEYLDSGVTFYSRLARDSDRARQKASGIDPATVEHYLLDVDKPLVIPTGVKIRMLLTANDVIHAWWVPEFGMKRDAIPGFINEMWISVDEDKAGTYRGQCAELCGKSHGFMPIVVEVKSKDDYAKWVDEQKKKSPAAADPNRIWEMKDLLVAGERVYAANCAACHLASGKGVPGAFPALEGSKIVTGPKAAQIALVLNGKPGTAMPPWTQLSDADLAAVITYTRNGLGNKTGEALQPSEIKAARP